MDSNPGNEILGAPLTQSTLFPPQQGTWSILPPSSQPNAVTPNKSETNTTRPARARGRPRRSTSQSEPPDDQPSHEPRYSTRHGMKPRVSLRESHPGLFSDSEQEASGEDITSTRATVFRASATEEVLADIGAHSSSSGPQLTPAPAKEIQKRVLKNIPPLPGRSRSRQTSTPTSTSSVTPPTQTSFKPPLPRPRPPPIPGTGQFQTKKEPGLLSLETAPLVPPTHTLSNRPLLFVPPVPSSLIPLADNSSSFQSPSISLMRNRSPPPSGFPAPFSQPSSLSVRSSSAESTVSEKESFKSIVEKYLQRQYGDPETIRDADPLSAPGHLGGTQDGAGDGLDLPSRKGYDGGGVMDVAEGGGLSTTLTSMSHGPIPLTTAMRELESGKKRPRESDNYPISHQVQSSTTSTVALESPSRAGMGDQTTHPTPPTPTSPGTKRPKYAYTQHPSHWVSDGNILVQIEQVRFKLHRSRLAKHSGYFRRILEGMVEGDGEERVVNLDDTRVKVTDFEILLDALEDFMDYFYTTPPFATAASILRASTALSFDKYSTWARRYLTDMWPTSIDHLSTSRIPHAIESLSLARECNVPSIRKRVLYELVRTPRFGQHQPTDELRWQLSPTDLLVLGTAREELTTLWIDVTAAPCSFGSALTKGFAVCVGADHIPTCTARDEARAELAHVKLVAGSSVFRDFVWDPVCGLQALIELDWTGEGFCVGCVEMRIAVWKTMREKVWDKLNVLFRLGGEGSVIN